MPLLTVNNTVYDYPDAGTPAGWGEDATAWAEAVTDVLNTLLAPGDILETSFVVANNASPGTIVNGLTFDAATTRAANITYTLRRTTDSVTSGKAEMGIIYLTYDNNGTSGNKWLISNTKYIGDAGIAFDIGDSGQVTYSTTNLSGTNYSATLKFFAKTLSV